MPTIERNRPKYFPSDVVKQAETALEGWKKNNQFVNVNGLSPADLDSALNDVKVLEENLDSLNEEIAELKEKLPITKRELFEFVQKVRNGARAAFGLHDTRLIEFGLDPNVRRGRPPKRNLGKQLGLELSDTGERA